jgi:hypothetical protein
MRFLLFFPPVKAARTVLNSKVTRRLWMEGVPFLAFLAMAGSIQPLIGQKPTADLTLPAEAGKTMVIDIPGLPADAKKLELILVPGLGTVPNFLLGKYEVTQGQYESLIHTNPSTFRKGPDYPVEETSWQDAKDFCSKLTTLLPSKLAANYYFRLPTDEEWSAAVGLPVESDGLPEEKSGRIRRVYPWGTEWPPPAEAGNYSDTIAGRRGGGDGFKETAPVARYPPNQFGLYDMGGNVWEWCEDWEDEEMNVRVVRGAAFFTDSSGQIISSYRGRPPIVQNFASGFRVTLASKANDTARSKSTSPVPLFAEGKKVAAGRTNCVSVLLGQLSTEAAGGVIHLPETGGRGNLTVTQVLAGVPCRLLQRPGRYSGSFYFEVGSDFKGDGFGSGPMNARVDIDYFAKPDTAFRLQFDGLDGGQHQKYQPVLPVGAKVLGFGTGADYGRAPTTGAWSVATFHLTNAIFMNSQKDGADFRLEVVPPDLYVRRVTVTRESTTR